MSEDAEPSKSLKTRRNVLEAALLAGAGVLLAGGGIGLSLTEAAAARAKATPPEAPVATGPRTGTLFLVIATPDMLGTENFPAYIPAYPVIPSHATVRVEIANFDDATVLTGGLSIFAKVSGTVDGTIRVIPLNPKVPNSLETGQVYSALDPSNVAHTFTVADLGINVPVAPKARTVFTIQTGAPGTFPWRCNDPCGTSPDGFGGAMVTPGYMMGKLTIQ